MTRTLGVEKAYNFVDKAPIIDRIRTILNGMGWSYKELSLHSGISYSGLYAIFEGKTKDPRFSTIASIVIALGQSDMSIVEQKQRNRK